MATELRIEHLPMVVMAYVLVRVWWQLNLRKVLLSWGGTVFEYLMPLIFQRSYGNTLLEKAARGAVAFEIDYGRKRRVPSHQLLQYLAFGIR